LKASFKVIETADTFRTPNVCIVRKVLGGF
jgi:hypothetical protein